MLDVPTPLTTMVDGLRAAAWIVLPIGGMAVICAVLVSAMLARIKVQDLGLSRLIRLVVVGLGVWVSGATIMDALTRFTHENLTVQRATGRGEPGR